jgi:hypothetical protein
VKKPLWEIESDGCTFKSCGFDCEIKRHPSLKHLCGYVDVPVKAFEQWPSFESYEWECPDDDPRRVIHSCVHGGVTYDRINGDVRRIGFDCGHAGDLSPGGMRNLSRAFLEGFETAADVYRDMKYVTGETRKLAKHLAALVKIDADGVIA